VDIDDRDRAVDRDAIRLLIFEEFGVDIGFDQQSF
jgi:hypothetical protein